jgi:hypothetical protein
MTKPIARDPGELDSKTTVFIRPWPSAAGMVIEATMGPGLGVEKPLGDPAEALAPGCRQYTRTVFTHELRRSQLHNRLNDWRAQEGFGNAVVIARIAAGNAVRNDSDP